MTGGVKEVNYKVTLFFFFQAEDGIRDLTVTGVQTCALPISFSRAFCRQRSWNSHSLQCRFRTRSGGEALVATSAIFGASFRTSPNKPSVLTFNVVCSSPWMILPKLTSRPSNSDNPSESNANNKRSSRVSLFLKLKRIGTNFAGLPLPSDTTRSIACSRDSKSSGPGCVCTSDVPSAVWPGVASRLLCGPESPSEPARADTEKSTADRKSVV